MSSRFHLLRITSNPNVCIECPTPLRWGPSSDKEALEPSGLRGGHPDITLLEEIEPIEDREAQRPEYDMLQGRLLERFWACKDRVKL